MSALAAQLVTQLVTLFSACLVSAAASFVASMLWSAQRTGRKPFAIAALVLGALVASLVCLKGPELASGLASGSGSPVQSEPESAAARRAALLDDFERFARDGVMSERLRGLSDQPTTFSPEELRRIVGVLTNGPYADRAAALIHPIADSVIEHIGSGAMRFDEGTGLLFQIRPCRWELEWRTRGSEPPATLDLVATPQPVRLDRWVMERSRDPLSTRARTSWSVHLDSVAMRDVSAEPLLSEAIEVPINWYIEAPPKSAVGGHQRVTVDLQSDPIRDLLERSTARELLVTWTLVLWNGGSAVATQVIRSELPLAFLPARDLATPVPIDTTHYRRFPPAIEFHRGEDAIVDGKSVPGWQLRFTGSIAPQVDDRLPRGSLLVLVEGVEIARLPGGLEMLECWDDRAGFVVSTSWHGKLPPERVALQFLPDPILDLTQPVGPVTHVMPAVEIGSVVPVCHQRLDRWWDSDR